MLSFCTTMHTCSESVIKWVVISTATLHIQTGRLALLLFHTHPHRVVLPWNQDKNLLGET